MSGNVGIADTLTSHFNANVGTPGPTGEVGDMKKNPVANTNITQNDPTSVQHASRELADTGHTGTKAYENSEDLKKTTSKSLDPETQRTINKAVISNDTPVRLDSASTNANPPVTASYGDQ